MNATSTPKSKKSKKSKKSEPEPINFDEASDDNVVIDLSGERSCSTEIFSDLSIDEDESSFKGIESNIFNNLV